MAAQRLQLKVTWCDLTHSHPHLRPEKFCITRCTTVHLSWALNTSHQLKNICVGQKNDAKYIYWLLIHCNCIHVFARSKVWRSICICLRLCMRTLTCLCSFLSACWRIGEKRHSNRLIAGVCCTYDVGGSTCMKLCQSLSYWRLGAVWGQAAGQSVWKQITKANFMTHTLPALWSSIKEGWKKTQIRDVLLPNQFLHIKHAEKISSTISWTLKLEVRYDLPGETYASIG